MDMRRALLAPVLVLLAVSPVAAQELKELFASVELDYGVSKAALRLDGKVLAAGGGDTRGCDLRLWDVATGKELARLPGCKNSLSALAWSADGKRLAAGDIDHQVFVWDSESAKPLATLKGHTDWVHALAFSPDGKTLVSAGGKEVKRWDLTAEKEIGSFHRTVQAWSMAFSPDARLLASPDYPEIDLWDLAAGKPRHTLSEHRGAVRLVAFTTDSKTLVSASCWSHAFPRSQGQVKLWDVATGKERTTIKGEFKEVRALAIAPDGRSVAVVDITDLYDRTVRLQVLDVATSDVRLTRSYADQLRVSPAFLADGRLLIVSSSDGKSVKLLEASLSRHPPR